MSVPNIVVYANCQSKGIKYFLSAVIKANFEELINYEYIRDKKDLPIDIIKKADVFIYQPIKAKHGIYSTDPTIENSICTYLSPHCKKISFPYIYNSAFWSFLPESVNDKIIGNPIDTLKPIRDLKERGYSFDKVKEMFLNGEIDFKYRERFEECMDILIKKEEFCDVKVSEFIILNVQNIKLFLTENHPTTYVYIHCVNQILKLLGNDKKINYDNYDPNLIDLLGNYAHTTYDIRFWNFKYSVTCHDFAWIEKLEKIYESI